MRARHWPRPVQMRLGVPGAHSQLVRRRAQEFERSSTRLDLRYVPDEQTFEGREPRDVALAVCT